MKRSIVCPSIIIGYWVKRSRVLQTLRKFSRVVVAKLRDLAPYAAMELILPGGSLMALLVWFDRRRKQHWR
jgi:hypothetical protein